MFAKKKQLKLKIRYITAAALIIVSIAVTPACIEMAYQSRGYKAYGGEYLIIPLGMVLAVVILETAKEWDNYLFRRNQNYDSRESGE